MRVLITGLSSYWGGRLAQVLEKDDAVETIIGVSTDDPTCELHRTEYVRVGTQHALLRRIVHAAEIDTVVDTRLVVDSATAPPRVAHEQNVIGTMNILTACGGPNSPVTKVVFKSSAHYYGCERDDPSFFTETMRRPHEPRTRLESDIVEADDAVQRLRRAQPRPHRHDPALLQRPRAGPQDQPQRAAEPPRGPRHPRLRPALPVHPRGRHRRRAPPRRANDLPGIYNAAPDGVLALSEVASLLGKPLRAGPAALGHRARGQGGGHDRHPDPGRGPPATAIRPRSRQPRAQAVRLPLRPHDARSGAGIRRSAAARAAAGERRGAISLRARSGGISALLAERAPRRVSQLTRKHSCSPSRCAARPPTISGPHAYSPDRPRHRSGAARPRWRSRRLLLRPGQAGPDRPRGEGQRRPDRGDDPCRGGAEAVRRRCWSRSTARSRSATRTTLTRSLRRRPRSGSTSAARSTRRCGARRRATCSPARGATCATSRSTPSWRPR